jgi:hypothetical protein
MNLADRPSSSTVARRELEGSWRRKLDDAHLRYRTATARYRELLDMEPQGRLGSQDDPLVRAWHAESEAMAEYKRLLKVFAELTLHGRMPQRQAGSSAGGGAH